MVRAATKGHEKRENLSAAADWLLLWGLRHRDGLTNLDKYKGTATLKARGRHPARSEDPALAVVVPGSGGSSSEGARLFLETLRSSSL